MVAEASWPLALSAMRGVVGGARLWRTHSQLRCTLVVKASFAMRQDKTMEWVAPDAVVVNDHHYDGNPDRSLRASSDLAPYLPRADVLLSGNAHAQDAGTRQMAVRLAVIGERPLLDKTLHIFGDRSAAEEGEEQPVPRAFDFMPISYERAHRGSGFDENPSGISVVPGGPLPNIVDPTDPEGPAGFGPIGSSWPIRRRLLRDLDPTLLDASIPDLPDAFAWSYFHAAPADQRCPFLTGGEWIVLDGLHPLLPRVESKLPGGIASARIYGLAEADPYLELPMSADILRIDPERDVCSLTYRGNFAIRDEAALPQIRALLGLALPGRGIPWPDSPRPSGLMRAVVPASSPGSDVGSSPPMPGSSRENSQPGVPPSAPQPSGPVSAPISGQPASSEPLSQPAASMQDVTNPRAPAIATRSGGTLNMEGEAAAAVRASLTDSGSADDDSPTPQPMAHEPHRAPSEPPSDDFDDDDDDDVATRYRPADPHALLAAVTAQAAAERAQALVQQAPAPTPEPPPADDLDEDEDEDERGQRTVLRSAEESLAQLRALEEPDPEATAIANLSDLRALAERASVTEEPSTLRGASVDARASSAGLREADGSAPKPVSSQPGSPRPSPMGGPAVESVPRIDNSVGPHAVSSHAVSPHSISPHSVSPHSEPTHGFGQIFDEPTVTAEEDDIAELLAAAESLASPNEDGPMTQKTPSASGASPPAVDASPRAGDLSDPDEGGRTLQKVAPAVHMQPPALVSDLTQDPVVAATAPQADYDDAPEPPTLPPPAPPEPLPAHLLTPSLSAPAAPAISDVPVGPEVSADGSPRTRRGVAPPAPVTFDSGPTWNPTSPVVAPPTADLVPQSAAAAPGSGVIATATPLSPAEAREEIARRLQTGEPLSGLIIPGADLSDLDLSGRDLSGSDLSSGSLRGSNLAGANLSHCNLHVADLSGAVLDDACLEHCDLHGAVLTLATFRRAKLSDANFSTANGDGVIFEDATGERALFSNSVLKGAQFARVKLASADFTEAAIDDACFDNADLPELRVYEADAHSASFVQASLPGARFDSANLEKARLDQIYAPDSVWDQSFVDDASFEGAMLPGASFVKASCRRTIFSKAELSEARLKRARLEGAKFYKSDVSRATFEGADLRGALLPPTMIVDIG